jgi:hypothetical protein
MRKPRKGVEERYMKALRDLYDALLIDEKTDINQIMTNNKVGKVIPSILRKKGVIIYTLKGNRWVSHAPTIRLVHAVIEESRYIAQRYYKNKKTKQPAFEWEKPQPKAETVVNYEYKPQPDSSLVSEFIDHHEQSLLPHVEKHVKTAEIVKSERLFQLRIFGINLFTVKY